MKISNSLPRASFHWQQLHWGTRAIAVLGGCALIFFLFKKALSYSCPEKPPAPPTTPGRPATPVPAPLTPTTPERPATPVPAPLPPDPASRLDAYLTHTLLLNTPDLLSQELGTQLEHFPIRGITTLEDLQTLGLRMFSEALEAFSNRANKVVIDQKGENIKINNQINEVLEDVTPFIDRFVEANTRIQAIFESNDQLRFDLSTDIDKLQEALETLKKICAKPSNRLNEVQKNKKSLSSLLDQLKEIDRKRQLHWLKGYLLQQDLLRFWGQQEANPQARSLSVYRASIERIETADLFRLGYTLAPTE
jgi:hypothetical protein